MSAHDDRSDVEGTLSTLVRSLDARDWTAVAGCLTEDFQYVQPVSGAFVARGEIEGRDAFLEMAGGIEQRATIVQHYLANIAISVKGQEAQASASAFVVHVFGEGENCEIVQSGATMELAFRRTAEGWRASRLVGTPVWRDPRFVALATGAAAPGRTSG